MSGVRGLLARLAVTFLALVAAGVQAGGPLGICNDAARTVLAYSPAVVNLNYDQGPLGSRTKDQADAIVTNAVSLWTNVGTATVTIGRGVDLPVDVTSANYLNFLDNFGDGLNPVIYDSDGSITDLIFGVGAKNNTLGFAGSAWFNQPACRYAEGQAVINGFISVSDTTLGLTMAHEVGHLIGLDHTQLDSDQGLTRASYPLMYPFAARNSLTLHEDDVAAVSALYPDATLNSVYGQLSGVFVDANGVTPVRGANLWARETTTDKVYSIVSDYRLQNTGFFKLLLPAGNYNLRAEAIYSGFDQGSSVGPYAEVYPTSPSFQPPLYVGGVPMAPVTLGNGSPLTIAISAGCAATATFRIDGTGSVGGNCVPAPAVPACSVAPTAASVVSGTGQSFTASCTNSPSLYVWRVDGVQAASGSSASFGTGTGLPVGAHTVSVTASNGAGASAPANASLTVTAPPPDTTPPSTPSGLFLSAVSSSQITVNWTASTDNVGVTQYRIRRNGAQVGTVSGNPPATAFTDLGLAPSTFYSYTVQACDAAGNCSGQSNAASANTLAAAPVCTIAPTAATVATGTSQTFTASCSNSPTFYVWKVDGVQTASGAAATSFGTGTGLAVGAHTVSVTASNAGGASTPANATLTVAAPVFRAYLKSTGNDANPCSLAAPCRQLPAALAAVVDGGEVWMLDSANYNAGPVDITRSVTILAVPGHAGSLAGLNGRALAINAPGIDVTLQNLTIFSFGNTGDTGVLVSNAANVSIINCNIFGFNASGQGNGVGIWADTGTNFTKVNVVESVVRNNLIGILAAGNSRVTISKTHVLANSATGIMSRSLTGGFSVVEVSDSVSSGNSHGFMADGCAGACKAHMFVTRSTASENTVDGFTTRGGTGAVMVVDDSMATHNLVGFNNIGGTFQSRGNNTVAGNTNAQTNGAITLKSGL